MSFVKAEYYIAGLLAWALVPTSINAAVLNVPSSNFPTIQAAVTSAVSGDEILIAPGTYTGTVTLKSGVDLRGVETARTLLRSTNSTPVITITDANNIVIRNLTFSGGNGILIEDSTAVDIVNNVFNVGSGNTAVRITGAASTAEVVNNTFFSNGTAISRASDLTTIENNIFASNGVTIVTSGSDNDNISSNCFAIGGIGTGPITGDPEFVDTDARDFHLLQESACKDIGIGTDDFDDSSQADAGAYGGEFPDTTPFPLARPSAEAVASATPGLFDVTLEWEPNLSYMTEDYRIHYDSDESGPDYEGDDAENPIGVTSPSPIDVGGDRTTDSFTLFSLLSSPVTPAAPVLESLAPSNETLTVRWSAVDDATGYRINYGLASVAENEEDTGNVTEFDLHGLENGQPYLVQVSALHQTTYYITVSVLGIDDGGTAASIRSPERAVAVGDESESAASNQLTGIPEPVEPFPALPDEGEGCFIATAAYGYYSHPQVQVLREFRDRYLLASAPGRAFVKWYYRHSPDAAAYIARHETLKTAVRWALLPFIGCAYLVLHMPAYLLLFSILLAAAISFGYLRHQAIKTGRWN
ncbi:MAG TPA: CFI-box-CTERM domain-containing protein [Gammaproteobacteria bacterium]